MIALVYIQNPTHPQVFEGPAESIANDLRDILASAIVRDGCDITIRVVNAGDSTRKL